MQDFHNDFLLENLNAIITDKLILRFLQDNVLTDETLIKQIDDMIAKDRNNKDQQNQSKIHNTMFSMTLKIILFKYLYSTLKNEFLERYPNSVWLDLINSID